MKISILGAGAMGSLFGGLLAESGHAVELLDVNPEHISRIRERGLSTALHTLVKLRELK